MAISNRCLNFHPENWGGFPIWRAYFSDGLKSPTRNSWDGLLLKHSEMNHPTVGLNEVRLFFSGDFRVKSWLVIKYDRAIYPE